MWSKKTLFRRRREIRYCFQERILLASACNDWSRRQCSRRPSITAVTVSCGYANKSFRRSYYIYIYTHTHTHVENRFRLPGQQYGTSYYYILLTWILGLARNSPKSITGKYRPIGLPESERETDKKSLTTVNRSPDDDDSGRSKQVGRACLIRVVRSVIFASYKNRKYKKYCHRV